MRHLTSSLLLAMALLPIAAAGQVRMKRIVQLSAGPYWQPDGRVLCTDSDHDGLPEVVFKTGYVSPSNPKRWEIWENRPGNRFQLVYADTGTIRESLGIVTGNFRPLGVGDIDQDGLVELVGENEDWTRIEPPDSFYNLYVVMESRDSSSYPDSMVWFYRWDIIDTHIQDVIYPGDMDGDGRAELLGLTFLPEPGFAVWENLRGDSNHLVWVDLPPGSDGLNVATGDFDRDGRQDFFTAGMGTGGRVTVWENTGDDQYDVVFQDTVRLPNGSDVFTGNDVDGDGRPEFFVSFYVYPTSTFHLYMWEATGDNQYRRRLVARKGQDAWPSALSRCADIDGDGREEIVWATDLALYVYKAVGDDTFQQIWYWNQDHGTNHYLATYTYDVNNDGYTEIVVGGSGKTSVFEIEAIRVLYPNGGQQFRPGDTCLIRWQTFDPPRCDSISLFLRKDTSWNLDTIDTGLLPSDTSYRWVVPNTPSDSCRIVAIAYGPGWQYDESDQPFRILPAGVQERPGGFITATALTDIAPNPLSRATRIRFQLRATTRVHLSIRDVSGRTVATLADEALATGRYCREWQPALTTPRGIYFLSFSADERKDTRKLILTAPAK